MPFLKGDDSKLTPQEVSSANNSSSNDIGWWVFADPESIEFDSRDEQEAKVNTVKPPFTGPLGVKELGLINREAG